MPDNTNQEKAEVSIKLTPKVILREKSPFSRKHIKCAHLCANECEKIEREYREGSTWNENAELYENSIAYASGSIISSIAYLESVINEFYSDCFDTVVHEKVNDSNGHIVSYNTFLRKDKAEHVKGISLKSLIILAERWNCDGFERKDILSKYEEAIKIIAQHSSDENEKAYIDVNAFKKDQTYKDVKDLIKIRNSLVHYKAKWQGFSPEDKDSYNFNYLNGKFEINPFMKNSDRPFFPHKCLGKGCARWGIESSINFVSFFYNNIDMNI